ncbi:MAG: TetR/AcrR family transcriptional regulator [Myxococcota bacterium]
MSDEITDPYEVLPNLRDTDVPEMAAKIMAAGLKLFAQKGYAATSVREIVSSADVTNPMLYYYFQSKEGLFNELVEYLFEAVATLVNEELEGASTVREQLDAVAWAQIRGAKESPIILKFVYSILFGPSESRPPIDIYSLHFDLIAGVSAIMDRGIRSGELTPREGFDTLFLTNQFMGAVNEHLMRALTIAGSLEEPRVREEFLDQFLSREESERLVHFFLAGAGAAGTR